VKNLRARVERLEALTPGATGPLVVHINGGRPQPADSRQMGSIGDVEYLQADDESEEQFQARILHLVYRNYAPVVVFGGVSIHPAAGVIEPELVNRSEEV
jgi:hypothetical protein